MSSRCRQLYNEFVMKAWLSRVLHYRYNFRMHYRTSYTSGRKRYRTQIWEALSECAFPFFLDGLMMVMPDWCTSPPSHTCLTHLYVKIILDVKIKLSCGTHLICHHFLSTQHQHFQTDLVLTSPSPYYGRYHSQQDEYAWYQIDTFITNLAVLAQQHSWQHCYSYTAHPNVSLVMLCRADVRWAFLQLHKKSISSPQGFLGHWR